MERERNILTDTYSYGEYLIDIVHGICDFEAYIQLKGYGIKALMFSISKDDIEYDKFIELVTANIDEHIRMYLAEYVEG